MGVKTATTYDQYGNAIENVIQPASNQPFMKTVTEYDANDNYVQSQKDARGNSTQYMRTIHGYVLGVTDPSLHTTYYVRDRLNRVTMVMAERIEGNKVLEYKQEYKYTNDRLTRISHNTTENDSDVEYNFEYDALGRKKKVKVGSTMLSENVYSDDRKGLLEEMNFGNGAKIRYEYDDFGRTIAIYVDEPDPNNEGSVIVSTTPKYEFKYDARGIASVIKDNVLMTETRVTSDLADRPSESVTRDAEGNLIHKSLLNYDGKNRVKELIDVLPDSTHKAAYTYDADNRVTEVKFDNSNTHKVNYTYDLLNRITNRTVTNSVPYATTYGYLAGDTVTYGANATTPLVATITQGEGANQMNFAYTYDNRGNIMSETRTTAENPDGVTVSYEYDELGQLIRVNDPNDKTAHANGTTWIYTYDRGGNILNKAVHVYTTSNVSATNMLWEYRYEDSNWKDKLTGYADRTYTYDAIGNPESDQRDGFIRHFEWEAGRKLKCISGNGFDIRYKYNSNGIRTQKVWQPDWYPVTVNYVLKGKEIAQMTVDYTDLDEIPHQEELYFHYDAQGKPATVSFNGVKYTYIHNLQGDIVGILDSNGTLVVEYKYDAWGRPLSTSGSMAETLGKRNPFRYRGYVWDEETGLYYLRSRYYDPELGRFINADVLLTKNIIPSIYSYVENNPIIKRDTSGYVSTRVDGMYISIDSDRLQCIYDSAKEINGFLRRQVISYEEIDMAINHPIPEDVLIDIEKHSRVHSETVLLGYVESSNNYIVYTRSKRGSIIQKNYCYKRYSLSKDDNFPLLKIMDVLLELYQDPTFSFPFFSSAQNSIFGFIIFLYGEATKNPLPPTLHEKSRTYIYEDERDRDIRTFP